MSARPTMVDVAREAGVSLKTVSRVVNGVASVDPALSARVTAAIGRLGYRHNAVAASLRAGRTDVVGLVIADLANPYYSPVALAVAQVAASHGQQVIMASSEEDPELERRLVLDLLQRRVAGLLVVPAAPAGPPIDHDGVPIVYLDRPGPAGADAVVLDDVAGARAVVAELVAGGASRVALLFDTLSIPTMERRLAGARAALAEAGLEPAATLTGLHSPAAARDAVAELLARDRPDAIFGANNRVTTGAVEAVAGSAGASVAVGGFDDFELAHLMPVPLVLAAADTAELGRLGAELLSCRIGGDDSPPAQHLIPTRVVRYG